VRTTGSALCLAGGRFGAMMSPLVFEKLSQLTGANVAFFVIMAVLTALNALIIDFVPFEPTTSMMAETLEDTIEESNKIYSDLEGSSYGVTRSTE